MLNPLCTFPISEFTEFPKPHIPFHISKSHFLFEIPTTKDRLSADNLPPKFEIPNTPNSINQTCPKGEKWESIAYQPTTKQNGYHPTSEITSKAPNQTTEDEDFN